jgi:hypothetical protein
MKHMKKTLALCLIGILSISLISIPSARADFTISFNTSCTTAGTNCNDITLEIGDSGASTPFRSFDGDAEGTGWLMTGTFPSWNSAAIQPNGTAGGFTMTIEGGTVSSQPLSLQFKSEDIDMLFLNDISSSGFLDYDPWLVPITHDNNASPPKFSLDYSTFARIQNPSEITLLNGTYQLSIEHRVRFLDGISGISGGDQTIAFSNYTFTNSNKGNSMLTSFVTDTTTLTTSTKEFIRLNAVFYDRVRGELTGSMTLTTGKYPRIEYQTFYDDVFFQNNWDKAEILNLTSCAGTFADPCESGQQDLLQDFNPRSRWHFDFPVDYPNAEINPDGFEGWVFQTGFSNRTNNDQGSSGCTVSPFCIVTHTITRTTAVSEPSFPSTAFTPKSIQGKVSTNGGGNSACGISSPLNNDTNLLVRMRERLFLTESEQLKFVLFHRLIVTANNVESDDCDFNATGTVRLIDPDGNVLATTTVFDEHFEDLDNNSPVNTAWSFDITQPSSLSNTYTFLDIDVQWRITNITGGCATTGGGCIVTYNFFMDSYASNWQTFMDQNGDQCDTGEECTVQPLPTCNELGYTTDQAVALTTGKCLIPTSTTFCEQNPTDPLCTGIDAPIPAPDITIGGQDGVGGIAVDCGSGTLDFTPIDFTNTELATNSVTNLLTNIGIIMGCAPTLWIPLITLLGGIGSIAAFVSKDVAIHGIFAFIMVWAFFFAVVGFIPFWMALITAMGIIGLWILIGKRTLTTTTG